MITLYHSADAHPFRALRALEEVGEPYELKLLPFPPRVVYCEPLSAPDASVLDGILS